MPEDFSKFIIPQQDFSGLYKIGDILAAKETAKAKAAKAGEKWKPYEFKDLVTETIEDANLYKSLSEINDLGMQLAASGANDAYIMQQLSPKWNKLLTSSLNIKERKRQISSVLTNNKSKPGIDADRLEKSLDRAAWYDENGKIIDDFSKIDPTVDIGALTLTGGDIYNVGEAVQAEVNKRAKQTQMTDVLRRDSKGGIYGTKVNMQTADGFIPKFEKDAQTGKDVFVGVEPLNYVAPDNEYTQAVKDYFGVSQTDPLKFIDDKQFNHIRSTNDEIRNAVDQETKKFVANLYNGQNPTQDQINQATAAFQKARYYQLYDEAGKGFLHQDVEKKEQPVIKTSTTVINKGASGAEVMDIHTPTAEVYRDMQKQLGKKDFYMPMNQGKSDFIDAIVKAANSGLSDKTTYDQTNITVKLNDNDEWEVYKVKKDANNKAIVSDLITTVPATSLNYKVQPGAKEKRKIAKEAKTKKGKKKFD